jgi:hypothetical protein
MKRKTNQYERALLKKLSPLVKFNELAYVYVQMRAPYMSPNGFPTELVPVSEMMEKISSDWHLVLRPQPEPKNG